jgi:hypothetical protein
VRRGDDRNRTGVDGFAVRRKAVLSASLFGFPRLPGALRCPSKSFVWGEFGESEDSLVLRVAALQFAVCWQERQKRKRVQIVVLLGDVLNSLTLLAVK